MSGYMTHVSRERVAGDHQDTLSGFYWDLRIDHWPTGVYFNSGELYDTLVVRCKTATPPSSGSISLLDTTIHGQKLIQPGDIDYSGELSITLQDFEDQYLSYFFNDWMTKIMDRETRLGLRKNQLYMDATLIQLSRGLEPVKYWECKTGILSSFDSGENFGGENTIHGELNATISFEWINVRYPGTGQ